MSEAYKSDLGKHIINGKMKSSAAPIIGQMMASTQEAITMSIMMLAITGKHENFSVMFNKLQGHLGTVIKQYRTLESVKEEIGEEAYEARFNDITKTFGMVDVAVDALGETLVKVIKITEITDMVDKAMAITEEQYKQGA